MVGAKAKDERYKYNVERYKGERYKDESPKGERLIAKHAQIYYQILRCIYSLI